MAQPIPEAERAIKPLWRNLNFTLMWTSVTASGFGDRLIALVAMALVMGATTQGETTFNAATQFFFFLPYLIFSPPAGWLADIMPRKWLMFGCDIGRSVLMVAALLFLVPQEGAAAFSESRHWQAYLAVFLVGSLAAVFSPTRNATIPQLVPVQQLQAGNAIIVALATIASLIGLGVGGEMLGSTSSGPPPQAVAAAATQAAGAAAGPASAVIGVTAAAHQRGDPGALRGMLLIAAVIYAAGGVCLAFLRVRPGLSIVAPQQRPGGVAQLFAALGYSFRHRRVAMLMAVNLLIWSAAFIVYIALMAVCDRIYEVPKDQLLPFYTRMAVMLGAGMLAGAFVVAMMNTLRESELVGHFGLMMSGGCILLLAFNPFYYVGLALAFGVGFFGNLAIICFVTLVQGITPNFVRGRVMGIYFFATTVSTVLVNFIIWRLPESDANGIMITSLKVTGPVLLVIAGIGLWNGATRGPLGEKSANALWRLDRIFMLVWHRVRGFGKHHVPMSGPVIIASNHTAGIDPFLIQAVLIRRIRWIMVNKNHYKILAPMWKITQPIVLEEGKSSLRQMRQVLESLEAGEAVGIFPEGGLQRDHRELQPFQPGLGMMAARSGAAIVPVWITGTPVRKKMIWHFLQPSRSRVYFGKPFSPDRSQSNEAIVEELRRRMLELARQAELDCGNTAPPAPATAAQAEAG